MIKQKLTALGVVWAVVTLFFLVLLLLLDISEQRENLQLESSIIYEHAYERALVNEVLLHNFVELVETDPDNLDQIRRYATEMREHYPHILRLMIHERIQPAQVESLEREMHGRGYPRFRVRTVHPETHQLTPARTGQPVYYPITFVEPMNAEGERLLGLDSYSFPGNRAAMMQASYYLDVFASDPYPLVDGSIGYRLFHALDATVLPQENAHRLVSLTIRADELLPPLPHIKSGLRVTLFDGQGKELVTRREKVGAGPASESLLPVLAERRSISRFGQSLEVLIEKQLRWNEMNWPIALVVLIFSAIAYLLTQQNYQRKQEAEGELVRLNRKLRQERDLLEDRVQERTWELVKTNSELRKQVKENRSLTQKVLIIQEEERRNIARELHDEMGQSLTAIRTDAHLLKQLTQEDPESVLHQAAHSIDSIAQRIYSVTYGLMRALRPSALDDLGLADALKECIANTHLDTAGVQLHLEMEGALNELNEALNISCYRLVQEALNNCVKHAEAKNIWLSVRRESSPEGRLVVSIEDDGKGFDERNYRSGFGLIGMRERVLAQGGSFNLRTQPEGGTRIEASLPVVEE
ncbi:CHASE domain-containing protein [Motiliproteus sp. SC1-56]|uniref:CHASE domain-containing protein n=1 Tax=Motiliproteus sp. SC1-56 TaxID=2799565 RepID=UPI001A8C6A66|nr:CHASE domain-containing protein [Motiliproteus sp. SC1-56]